jgi:hypothetical protein
MVTIVAQSPASAGAGKQYVWLNSSDAWRFRAHREAIQEANRMKPQPGRWTWVTCEQ